MNSLSLGCVIMIVGSVSLSLMLSSCDDAAPPPPPRIPLISTKVKIVGGRLELDVNSIRHPQCGVVDFNAQILPAFNSGVNSAQELYRRDDDGSGSDDDISVDIIIGISPPKFVSGNPKLLPAPFDQAKYNIITSAEDYNKLGNAGVFQDWMVIVQSLPGGIAALGTQGSARIIVTPTYLNGSAVAHELGHNFGLEHRDFIHPNGKRAMMHHELGSNMGDNCMLIPEEKRKIIQNVTTPPVSP